MTETEQKIKKQIRMICEPDPSMIREAKDHISHLAMPPHALGKLEKIGASLAGIQGTLKIHADKPQVLVFCADNGVIKQGVSSAPRHVTADQAVNMTLGKTGMAVLAKEFGAAVKVVDVGIADSYSCSEIVNRRVMAGTEDISKGPAMTRQEAITTLQIGIEESKEAAKRGFDLIGVGEMGIGNTTTSAAVLAALTGRKALEVTGQGGGITDRMLEKKISVIGQALCLSRPDKEDILDVLSKVGGLDLCAMCGAFLGAGLAGIPAVIDGFISLVAALCAVRLCPAVRGYLFPSHRSAEKGFQIAANALQLQPFLDLNMRLGEGSGCVLAFPVIRAACAVMNRMETFEEAGIDDGYLDEVRTEQRNHA